MVKWQRPHTWTTCQGYWRFLSMGWSGFPAVLLTGVLSACVGSFDARPEFVVDHESAQPGTAVKRRGEAVQLASGSLQVDGTLPDDGLTGADWKPYTFTADGRVKLVSIVPSVDTRVCEEQTHILGESRAISPDVVRITISRDLPVAQARFAAESNLANIEYLSDFKSGAFGAATGLLMKDHGLLARAVLVVDGQGRIRHLQVVPEITHLPDMDKAIAVANRLAAGQ